MSVRRTLPTRNRSLIGAWCFLDHYGPNDVTTAGGMHVPPHPHTGLQTVSWLFAGEVEHRDSGGGHAFIHPGEIALMTSGYGIAHSEVSTPATSVLHGVQLWVALPSDALTVPRDFIHSLAPVTAIAGGQVTVFVGSLLSVGSAVPTFTPLVGAEILVDALATIEIAVDPTFEHGVLLDAGDIQVLDTHVRPSELAYVPPGRHSISLRNTGIDPARMILIGGTPFEEEIVMWWNFVGRRHEDIVLMRDEWQNESDRFGEVTGFVGDVERLDAPALPRVRILPRGNVRSR